MKDENPRCPECDASLRLEPVQFEHHDEIYGIFPARRCPEGHTFFPETTSEAIEDIAKDVGHWGNEGNIAS